VWIVQIMLVGLYVQEISSFDKQQHAEKVDFAYWLIAVMFQIYAGDSQMGEAYNQKFWRHILVGRTAVSPASAEPLLGLGLPGTTSTFLPGTQASSWSPGYGSERPVFQGSPSPPPARLEEEEEEREEDQMRRSFELLGSCRYNIHLVLNMPFWHEWRLRSVMDFTVNCVARSIIFYSVPLMVCIEEPLDFVKDLTAVMFITLLDDIPGDPKDLKEMAVKTKFGLYRQPAQSLWQIIKSHCGYEILKDNNKLPLNRFEKEFVNAPQNADKFQRIATLASAEWESFLKQQRPKHSV